MPNKRNYQKELEQVIADHQRSACGAPSLLLHSCCAPCSSYVLEYLSQYFRITVLYFNPNIYPEEEYARRVKEQRRLIEEMGAKGRLSYPVDLIEGRFEPREFYEAVRGLEQIPEGGERCFACYRLRLTEAARIAAGENRDYFTTTLTISPLKNAPKLNEIGEGLASQYHVNWLPCDFKKKNGYKRSVELSAEYGLYRQDYCGCVFSTQEREREKVGLISNFDIPEKDVN
ncbi:MAG: epoxyqueuosine reductase QueH [Lachnospiraceae bacterium]|nr:epoxyqueuosine reductase QueH [Lachnospiraceae bacterium]